MAIERRPVLKPERSLPHRQPTGMITLIYKITGLSMYNMTSKVSTIKSCTRPIYAVGIIYMLMGYQE